MKTLRVLVADDHTLFREGLRQLLEMETDIEVVGEAANGTDAISMALNLQPDVILMDIGMPVVNGIEAAKRILAERADVGIIMLTMHHQDHYVLDSMRSGVRGYVLKDARPSELVSAVRTVARGASHLDPRMATSVLREFRRLSDRVDEKEGEASLTLKELEILKLLAAGLSNKEIGRRMFLAEKTVKNYLSTVFEKLQLNDRVQAAVYAIRHGLVPEQEQGARDPRDV